MKAKISSILRKIKSLSKRGKILSAIGIVIVLVGGFMIWQGGKDKSETLTIVRGNFLQQVSVSGKIVAAQDVDLSFEQTGRVVYVSAKEGNKVSTGQLLANQDTYQLSAQLAQMEAGISLQQAKLDQLLAGESPQSIKVAEDTVELAQQDLNNSYQNALNDLDSAYTDIYNSYTTITYMQNTYFYGNSQESIKVQSSKNTVQNILTLSKLYIDNAKNNPTDSNIISAISKMSTDIETVFSEISLIRNLCDVGTYYVSVSTTDKTSLDTKKATLNSTLDDLNSAKQSIADDKIALQKAKSQLDLAKAPPRSSDIAVYQSQIDQARAQKQDILSQISKKQIRSPIDGLVTKVNVKVGSTASANEVAVSVISSDPFQIESYIPEIYVGLVSVGDLASATLDAYGSEVYFDAKVISIDPAETVKEGVPTYRTKLQFMNIDDRIRSGMTANVIITTDSKENVISVPQGIVINKNGKKFIKIQQGKEIVEKEIQTGLVSSLGNIEITSGLNDGDVVIIK